VRELEYASLSAHVAGLIRYDLLLSGPHKFDARHARRKIQAALDRETLLARVRGQSRKLFLDYLIERAHGRTLTGAELDCAKTQIAKQLLKHVGPKHPRRANAHRTNGPHSHQRLIRDSA
jgi:hypothetical protein